MKTRILPLTCIFLLLALSHHSYSQDKLQAIPGAHSRSLPNSVSFRQGLNFPDYPILTVPESYSKKLPPSAVDNSLFPYMRPVFVQQGASCGQSAAVGYDFCYEINRRRDIPSNVPENQYPTHFTWNFMNAHEWYGAGVSYFHSYEILKSAGCPNEATFGPITMEDPYYWMTGYQNYLKAMHNRIRAVYSIPLTTPEGLNTLKWWLTDHMENSPIGGVANFYTGVNIYYHLPSNSPEPLKSVVINWNNTATHALTIVGYNDSIRFDLNFDGQFTNDIDITQDGIVDIRDWEIGGIKFVNSYGIDWGDNGYCYAMYSTLARKYGEGGIWNNAAHVLEVDSAYQPLLTIKTSLYHNTRGRVRIRAGISANADAVYPDHILEFPIFDYQGGDYYMQGGNTESDKEIEIGLDITPLIGYVNQNMPSRVFLLVDEKDPENKGSGIIRNFSVIRYDGIEKEYASSGAPHAIIENGLTILGVTITDPLNPLKITPEEASTVTIGSQVAQQFQVEQGTPPYNWLLKQEYTEIPGFQPFIQETGQKLTLSDSTTGIAAVVLPFPFPFYGSAFNTIYPHIDGHILFENMNSPYPYLKDEDLFMTQIRTIASYMNTNQSAYQPDDGIWYSPGADKASFTWRTTLSSGNRVNHKATLYPDGKIEFSYGTIQNPGLPPTIGISNGDGVNHQFSSFSGDTGIESGVHTRLIPESFPANLHLDQNGLLTSDVVDNDFAGRLTLLVTDKNRLSAGKTLSVNTGLTMDLQIIAGNNAVLEPNEQGHFTLSVKNNSPNDQLNTNLILTSESTLLTLTDSIHNVGLIPAFGMIQLAGIFNFTASNFSISEAPVPVLLRATFPGKTIGQHFSFKAISKPVRVSGPVVKGIDCYKLYPGENTSILMRLSHPTGIPEGVFIGKLTSPDPLLALMGADTATFYPNIENHCLEAEWKIRVNEAADAGRSIKFHFSAYTQNNGEITSDFNLMVGMPAIAVIDLDKNHNSAGQISNAIRNNGFSTDRLLAIDSTIFNFDHVFLCLGVKVNHHLLTETESELLSAFVEHGGNLYMEGGSTFRSNPHMPIHDKFRVTGDNNAFFDPPDTLAGQSGTPVAGMDILYKGDKIMLDDLIPESPAVSWFRETSSNFDYVVANDSISYKTIASTIEFGGIQPMNNITLDDLALHYLEFFGIKTQPLAANFVADYQVTCADLPVRFQAFCSGNPQQYNWHFEGGEPSVSNGQEVEVTWNTPGVYDVELTISDGNNSNTLTRNKFIRVYDCNSTHNKENSFFCKIVPNPSNARCSLIITSDSNRVLTLQVTDLTGNYVMNGRIPVVAGSAVVAMDEICINPGIYLVMVKDDNNRHVMKMIRY